MKRLMLVGFEGVWRGGMGKIGGTERQERLIWWGFTIVGTSAFLVECGAWSIYL